MKAVALLMTCSLLLSSCALKAQPKVVLGVELAPAERAAVPTPHRAHVLSVAVMPFDEPSGSELPVGEIAANVFTRSLLVSPLYKVLGETVTERSVKVESTVESSVSDGREKERVAVRTTERRADPIAWGRRVGAEAVVSGSVTIYRPRRLFILPPAKVAVDAKLIHVATRQVLWSATHTRGYGWWRWASWLVWPLGLTLAVTAPDADAHLEAASSETAHRILRLLNERG